MESSGSPRYHSYTMGQQPDTIQRSSSASSHSSILTHTANSFTPITKHYSLNDTLLKAFFQLYESGNRSGSATYANHQYTTALTIGLQYCRVALWDIPQHGYYNSPKYQDWKLKSAESAVKVSDLIVKKVLPQLGRARQSQKDEFLPKDGDDPQIESFQDFQDQIQEAQILHECAYETLKEVQSDKKERNKKLFGVFGMKPSPPMSWKQHELRSSSTQTSNLMERLLGDCSDAAAVLCPTSDMLNTVLEDEEDYSKVSFSEATHRTIGSADSSSIARQNLSPQSETKRKEYIKSSGRELERTFSAPARVLSPTLQEESSTAGTTPTSSISVGTDHQTSQQSQYESDLQRALYLSGLVDLPSNEDSSTHGSVNATDVSIINSNQPSYAKNLTPKAPNTMDIATLSSLYAEDYEEMNASGLIQVNFINTYQGRVPGSTNGCTVIAPLLAIHHLCPTKSSLSERNSALNEGIKHADAVLTGVHDDTITAIIDVQTPLVLPKVRSLMGLQKNALIIPSDVHDYLINEDFLLPQQFVDVFGGNILEDEHMEQFLKKFSTFCNVKIHDKSPSLSSGSKSESHIKRVAATLYFHEHVICIHRLTTKIQTDISIGGANQKKPNSRNLFHRLRGKMKTSKESATTIIEHATWYDVIDSLPSAPMFNKNAVASPEDETEDDENGWLANTARVTCNDAKSLQVYLRRYACSKFTPEDQKFINSYEWDDHNVDFDPRVFQAFIWTE